MSSEVRWAYRPAVAALWLETFTIRPENREEDVHYPTPIAVGLTEENAKHICDLHNASLGEQK